MLHKLYTRSVTVHFCQCQNPCMCCYTWPIKPILALILNSASEFYVASEELDKFMESQGASSPGILTLTTSLSKPFMRLDKYPTLLQELERHVEVRI